jgi:hypothetical protein
MSLASSCMFWHEWKSAYTRWRVGACVNSFERVSGMKWGTLLSGDWELWVKISIVWMRLSSRACEWMNGIEIYYLPLSCCLCVMKLNMSSQFSNYQFGVLSVRDQLQCNHDLGLLSHHLQKMDLKFGLHHSGSRICVRKCQTAGLHQVSHNQ